MEDNNKQVKNNQPLVEGIHYYYNDGMLVFTSFYLLSRGYCCGNGCRECPFKKDGNAK
jgi:hypothetical protein